MSKSKGKRRYTNDLGEAKACDCGGINLTMGPVTMHFAPDEMHALRELVDAGLGLMAGGEQEPARKAGRGKPQAQRPLH